MRKNDSNEDFDPRQRERNPVLTLFLILIGFFVLCVLLVVFRPAILSPIFGN